MSLIPDLNFTCEVDLHFRGNRHFGFECFAPVNPVYKSILAGSKTAEKVESLPSCDTVCQSSSSSQPNYVEFMALNRSKLLDLCEQSIEIQSRAVSYGQCLFNVDVIFDFDQLAWTTKNGEQLRNIQWFDSEFPLLNNKLQIVIFE